MFLSVALPNHRFWSCSHHRLLSSSYRISKTPISLLPPSGWVMLPSRWLDVRIVDATSPHPLSKYISPPLQGIGELNLSVIFINHFQYCQVVIAFDTSANPPLSNPCRRLRMLFGRMTHRDRFSDLSISSSYRISIILNGCLVYVEGMLIQAPLTSTTKSCSLGCKHPPHSLLERW